jgi:hypothetical protein
MPILLRGQQPSDSPNLNRRRSLEIVFDPLSFRFLIRRQNDGSSGFR